MENKFIIKKWIWSTPPPFINNKKWGKISASILWIAHAPLPLFEKKPELKQHFLFDEVCRMVPARELGVYCPEFPLVHLISLREGKAR